MSDPQTDPWHGDLLGHRDLGQTYTNLIQSIHESKVLSIEAGFGRGKTFFRKGWAAHLRAQGERVIEIDAQRSDHSGDPVVTFIGALVAALPPVDKSTKDTLVAQGKKYFGFAARGFAHVVLRNGAEELIDTIADGVLDQVDGMETFEDTVTELGDGMSKLAGQMIAAQMAAEQVREKEMPAQLRALRTALTDGYANDRVVILIDELDRCHPDYAIALLEAMKLVFDQDGYVFCLMANAEYLENLAVKRFGILAEGERYLDKFVDIRLTLPVTPNQIAGAAKALALKLPLEIPFGDDPEFSVERAAQLASDLAPVSGLSMRQIERVMLKVELALRCYRSQPLDCALLVQLAFEGASGTVSAAGKLKRRDLTSPNTATFLNKIKDSQNATTLRRIAETKGRRHVEEDFSELLTIPFDRFGISNHEGSPTWRNILMDLAPHYIPTHQAILNAVHRFQAEEPPQPMDATQNT